MFGALYKYMDLLIIKLYFLNIRITLAPREVTMEVVMMAN